MSIHKKLLEVQKSMPRIDKDSKNPHFKSNYASLANVLSVVLPELNKHGVYQTNAQQHIDAGWVLTVKLIDAESGESIETTLPLLNTQDMQKMGGSITYAHRYGLLPLLGIAPEMDDDGNSVSLPQKPKEKPLTQMEQDLLSELKILLISEKELIETNFTKEQQEWLKGVVDDKNFKVMPIAIDKIKSFKEAK